MKEINNKGRVNRYKYLLYFYGLFIVFILFYKFVYLPDLSNIILLAAVAPIFGFMSSFVNWPVYLQAVEAKGGLVINTRRLFSKKQDSILITKYNFDSYFETDHLHLGLNILDEDDKLQPHRVKISWMRIRDLRALEDKLREINPHAPTNPVKD